VKLRKSFMVINLRKRKHVPCFYQVIEHEWKVGGTGNEFSQTFMSGLIIQ